MLLSTQSASFGYLPCPLLMAEIAETEKLWPHNSSVMDLTLRVDTPCTYISASAATSAFSLRA